jgi:rod shape-determining protein MreC
VRSSNKHLISMKFTACVILSFLFMSIDKNDGHLEGIRETIGVFIYPLYSVIDAPYRAYKATVFKLRTQIDILEENDALRAENIALTLDASRYLSIKHENERLQKIIQAPSVIEQKILVANVLQIESSHASRKIVINKGRSHGVYRGQPVVDSAGVVGQVSHASAFYSTVVLITDAVHALPIVINRNGLRSVVTGSRKNDVLSLDFISLSDDIRVGDSVVTSGMGGVFPGGYPVGSIVSVESRPGDDFQRALVKPASKLGRFHEVLLIELESRRDKGEAQKENNSNASGTAG